MLVILLINKCDAIIVENVVWMLYVLSFHSIDIVILLPFVIIFEHYIEYGV